MSNKEISRWDDDLLQFARLIWEADSACAFTNVVLNEMSDSMDLPKERVVELIDRARSVHELDKATIWGGILLDNDEQNNEELK